MPQAARLSTAMGGWRHFLSEVFLPEGYPATVSEGKYLTSIRSLFSEPIFVDYLEYVHGFS